MRLTSDSRRSRVVVVQAQFLIADFRLERRTSGMSAERPRSERAERTMVRGYEGTRVREHASEEESRHSARLSDAL